MSNIDVESFLEALIDLKYGFIYDNEFHSCLNLFPLDMQESIDYPLVCSRDDQLDEPTATPFMTETLKKLLDFELNKFDYKIEDVHTGEKCKLCIKLPSSHNEIKVCLLFLIFTNTLLFICLYVSIKTWKILRCSYP